MTSTYPLCVPLYDTIRDAILTKADTSQLNLPHCDVAALCSHADASPLRELTCHMGSHRGRGDIPAFTPAEAGTRLSDPQGCKAELT